jgi:protocatechuate 3,4-dioxygenase beta subunit
MKPVVVLSLVGAAIAALFFVLFLNPKGDTPRDTGVAPVQESADPNAPRVADRTTDITLTSATGGREEASVKADRAEVELSTGEALSGAYNNGLTGVVETPEGEPLSGVKLELTAGVSGGQFSLLEAVASMNGSPPLGRWNAVSSDDGTFSFSNLIPDQPYRLIARHSSFAETTKGNFAIKAEGITDIRVVMARGYTLKGTVMDDMSGAVIANAELRLQGIMSMLPGADSRGDLVTTTDEFGQYEYLNVPAGTRNLTVSAKGYGSQTRTNLLFQGPIATTAPTTQDFRLSNALSLRGRVYAPDMTPIIGARVEATSYETAQISRGSGVTNQNGAFEIGELAEGTFMVIVRSPGFSDQRLTRVLLSDPDLEIIMARQGGVMGRVVSGKTGGPVKSFRASVRMIAPGATVYGRTPATGDFNTANGEFELQGLEAGSYALQVEAEGFAPTYSDTFIVSQGIVTPDIVVNMGQGGSITGRLVDANTGQPVANAMISTFDNGYVENNFTKMIGGMIPRTTTDRKVRTDSEGNFTVNAVTSATYQLQVRHPSYTLQNINDIIVQEGQASDLGSIRMYQGATIRGTVFDASGRPLPAATVTISGNGAYNEPAVTDDKGNYVIRNVPAGTWNVSAVRPLSQAEGNPFIAIIDVQASETTLSLTDGQEVQRDLTIGS